MATTDSSAPVTSYGTPATGIRNGPGTAALVLGIIAIVLSWTVVGGIVLAGGLIALGVSVLNSPAGKNLQQCLKNANGNKAAVSQCDAQYVSSH
jgi:hypothetical protein